MMSNIPSLNLVQKLSGHTDRVWAVAWSPTGELLASCSGDRTVRIWSLHHDSSSWECDALLEEEEHDRTIRSLSWSPDGQYLATANFDASTSIWRRQGEIWELVASLEGHENEVKSVAWSPAGTMIATCGRDRSVWIWEALPDHEFEVIDVKQGHSQDVKMVAWHPDGELLVSVSYDDTVKLWKDAGDEWECAQTLSGPGIGHTSTVWAVAFNAAGSKMVTCSDDCTVKVWKDTGGKLGWKLESSLSGHHSRSIFSVDWSSDDIIASAAGDNAICLFAQDVASSPDVDPAQQPAFRLLLRESDAHSADVNCVRWHPQQQGLLASAGDDNEIRLWQLQLRYATAHSPGVVSPQPTTAHHPTQGVSYSAAN